MPFSFLKTLTNLGDSIQEVHVVNIDRRNIFYTQNVDRKIPSHIRLLRNLLYVSVVLFIIIGTTRGPLWLIPPLGTLFLCWYMMGEAKVSYEYRLDGFSLKVLRCSGMRSRTKVVDFLNLDLHNLIIMAEEGVSLLDSAEASSRSAVPKRITYDVSAHDSDKGCFVAYATGIGQEEGRQLKIYFSPNAELCNYLRMLCPEKVHL